MANATVEKDQIFRPAAIYVSNEGREAAEIVVDLCVSFLVANLGIASNVFVIVVFTKQGFKESMNVSMTAIALWDLVKCLAGALQRMTGPVSLVSAAAAYSWSNITTVVMSYLLCFVTYVSSVLAAYVAVERCLCVTLPFLVKTLLTPRVTFVAMTTLSVGVFGSFVVMFGIYDIVWTDSAVWNRTVAVYRYNDFYYTNAGPLMMYYNLSGVIWPTVSFFVIVVCTVIIVLQLHKASQFRHKAKTTTTTTATTATATISDRDKQVVKMLVVIIGLYVFNLFPRIALYIVKFCIAEFYFLKKYHNIFMVVGYFCFLLDLLNSTGNLFVFLGMSSNFRATARQLFGRKKASTK